MIERYARPEMTRIWTEDYKLGLWLEVELTVCEAFVEAGEMPAEALARLRDGAKVDVGRVKEIEAVTRHDVAAFVQSIEEQVGPEAGRFVHLGLTSSDVLDTAFAMQLRDAGHLLVDALDGLADAIEERAKEHKDTVMVGRSHGIHAEPTTFGHVLAIWYDEVQRHRVRLLSAIESVSVGKISGAVGTFANVSPSVEEYACHKLGLSAAPASNQIVQRDRHAEYFCALAQLASSLEKFAVQVRHWQRTEVLEAEEFFHKGQKGSSSMPHKRNPVLSENVTGLARIVRGYAIPALENVALWHERDISHSSVERVSAPDATVTLHFALHRFAGVVRKLLVYPENMRRNLEQTNGLVYSQRVLLDMIRKGVGRERAYQLVQRNALAVWNEGGSFQERLLDDTEVREVLSADEIEACFDLDVILRHIDTIFARVFGQDDSDEDGA